MGSAKNLYLVTDGVYPSSDGQSHIFDVLGSYSLCGKCISTKVCNPGLALDVCYDCENELEHIEGVRGVSYVGSGYASMQGMITESQTHVGHLAFMKLGDSYAGDCIASMISYARMNGFPLSDKDLPQAPYKGLDDAIGQIKALASANVIKYGTARYRMFFSFITTGIDDYGYGINDDMKALSIRIQLMAAAFARDVDSIEVGVMFMNDNGAAFAPAIKVVKNGKAKYHLTSVMGDDFATVSANYFGSVAGTVINENNVRVMKQRGILKEEQSQE